VTHLNCTREQVLRDDPANGRESKHKRVIKIGAVDIIKSQDGDTNEFCGVSRKYFRTEMTAIIFFYLNFHHVTFISSDFSTSKFVLKIE
jgi:hypothetical protein